MACHILCTVIENVKLLSVLERFTSGHLAVGAVQVSTLPLMVLLTIKMKRLTPMYVHLIWCSLKMSYHFLDSLSKPYDHAALLFTSVELRCIEVCAIF